MSKRRSRKGGALWVFALFACLLSTSVAGEDHKRVLHVYAWSNFFAPDVLAAFENAYNCTVAIDTFDSNEAMYEDVLAGGLYDIITPSAYMTAELNRAGLLMELDHRLLPNIEYVDRKFVQLTEDKEMRHSVPYTRTVTGIGYNIDMFDGHAKSWSVFSRPEFAGRLAMLDDMRESLGAALKYLGYSLNTRDAKAVIEAGRLLQDWKRNLAGFEVDESNIKLGAGKFVAVQGYNGDLSLLMQTNNSIGFFVPQEGSAITTDDFVMLASSQEKALAHAFINHLLAPHVAAANMSEILYYMPIPEALNLLNSELRNSSAFMVPDDVLQNCEVIRDLGEDNELYFSVWEAVKNGGNFPAE